MSLFSFFERNSLPDEDTRDWLFQTFRRLLENTGGLDRFKITPLVLPNDEFFPLQAQEGQAMAQELFEHVRRLAGMKTWPCRLELVPEVEPFSEQATDLCTVFLGFGVILARSAFTFEQYETLGGHGWRYSCRGYLGPRSLAYALAIFARLRNIPFEEVDRNLQGNSRAYFKYAIRDVEKREPAFRPWP